jgi:hypothetical protein
MRINKPIIKLPYRFDVVVTGSLLRLLGIACAGVSLTLAKSSSYETTSSGLR